MEIAKKKMTTNTRVIKDILTKYKDTFQAFMELINNSIQADSHNIIINIDYALNDGLILGSSIRAIEIIDDGRGVPFSEFGNTILEIGTTAKPKGQGIGRFSALQIGSIMNIETIAYDETEQKYSKTKLSINSTILKDGQFDEMAFDVPYEYIDEANSYYRVTIEQLHSNTQKKIAKRNMLTDDFLETNIAQSIFENYPIQIFNGDITFIINNKILTQQEFIISTPISKVIPYKDTKGKTHNITFNFYNVKLEQYKVRVFFLIENAGIKTVAHKYTYSSDWYTPDLGTWFIYIDSSMFDSDLFRNLDMDSLGDKEIQKLKDKIKEVINDFFKAKNKRFEKFVRTLENDDSYPYKKHHPDSAVQELVFKKAAYLLEDEHELIKKDNKVRSFLYPLLDRAISNGDVEYVFRQISNLSDDTLNKFKSLLQYTDIEDIVSFTSSVSEKLRFLDFLHELIYGDISKVLLERKQLHKIVEKHLWLFGENYAFTPPLWSDKKIGNILQEIRTKFFDYELTKQDENLIELSSGLNDITDLFFLNERVADDGIREFMVVELKAPRCAISEKEIMQINRYAYTLETSAGLPSDKVRYKLILISSRLSGFARSQMESKKETYPRKPFLYDIKTKRNIEVYVMEWSELIEHNKRLLGYLSNQLKIRDSSVKEIFETKYSELIDPKVSAQLRLMK